jgi:hypothetical protein
MCIASLHQTGDTIVTDPIRDKTPPVIERRQIGRTPIGIAELHGIIVELDIPIQVIKMQFELLPGLHIEYRIRDRITNPKKFHRSDFTRQYRINPLRQGGYNASQPE